MKKIILLLAVILSAAGVSASNADATGQEKLAAAFIRNNDLWIKTGNSEKQITQGGYIRYPRWSNDGKWIAYTKGEERPELLLYNTETLRTHRIGPGSHVEWAPNADRLVFQNDGNLSIVYADHPDRIENKPIADHTGSYSWLPDGKGLLYSKVADLLPGGGWTDVQLYTVKLKPGREVTEQKLFFQFKSESDGFFAVTTSSFKWSADGRWIAFLALPTASLSADGNTLCFLSSNAKTFVKSGQMLNQSNWFQWSPKRSQLAYIEGTGREASQNKRLTIVEDIASLRQKAYTPNGFADNDFDWQDDRTITVQRVRETSQVGNTAPYLSNVPLERGEQTAVTQPPSDNGDYYPLFISENEHRKFSWVRASSTAGAVMLAEPNGLRPTAWIDRLSLASDYYGRRDWSQVIDYK
ncbi:PD40 domain-containing protein [Paenibacillus sp. NEAU-GSW1]|uniref:TolB family protein n=1 Tax=Paenibacillus sp. NEAU-GSW1 TaxID=2682486 RepID=UPI0012E1CA2A|nr:PD40 domain-containing protein [Paenibacillus sp. NEAU-GSW1]MUT68843.1 hypothetical protein [Paenibacillus sp. NEAU-GSW1]